MNLFEKQLHRLRRTALVSRFAAAFLSAACFGLALLLFLGIGDGLLGFESPLRKALLMTIGAIVLIIIVSLILSARRISLAQIANQADTLLSDPRRTCSAMLSLPTDSDSPLKKLLTARTLEQSSTILKTLPLHKIINWRRIALAGTALLLLVGTIFTLRYTLPDAYATISQRLLNPNADIAPYSKLRFAITPQQLSATYGGEISVRCEISGASLKHPVECLIRESHSGKILRLPAYRESDTSFSRQINNLTENIFVAFSCGKARSSWHQVDILLVPNILGGTVTITPPVYTSISSSSFPLESNQIDAIVGSQVSLELTSNRPLGNGSLELTAASGLQNLPLQVKAEIHDQTARFSWTVTHSGEIHALVSDLRGTVTNNPLKISFRALPDQAPLVNLLTPPAMLLATPTTSIPIEGNASDDFALSKFQFIRTLSGLRDRALAVAPSLQEKSFDFRETLDLKELGLLPGQTIELLLEANDHNPSMLGQGSSQISRIRIISDEEYAEIIRARTTIKQFQQKFEAAAQAMEQARESLEKLRQAVEKKQPDEIAKAAAQAAADHEKSLDTLNKIKEDFPAFEIEKELSDLAENQSQDLQENLDQLKNIDPKAPAEELQEKIDDMLGKLRKRQEQEQKLNQNVEEIRAHGVFLALAVQFKKIHSDQQSIVNRLTTILKELQQGIDLNRRSLPLLAETQEKNRENLLKFTKDLEAAIEAAPKDLESLVPMIDSATEFLTELKAATPEAPMENATLHAKAGRATDAVLQAQLALTQLERLLQLEGPFPEACRGEKPEFNIPDFNTKKSLEQLLQALLQQQKNQQQNNQNQQNPGAQGGQGGEGGMADGQGFSMMNIPMLGPERLQFESQALGSGKGKNDSQSGPPPPLPTEAAASRIDANEERKGATSAATTESIPDAYRDAVKRFLGDTP